MSAYLDGVDEQTARLILAFQLQDAEDAGVTDIEDEVATDAAYAYALFLEDLTHEQAVTAAVFDVPAVEPDTSPEPVEEPVQEPPIVYRNCDICNDDHPEANVLQVECEHWYCSGCLESLVSQSMVDESLFPPRCCQTTMRWERVEIFLPAELVRRFESKREELESNNRTYCYDAACSTFIGPSGITEGRGTCPRCEKATCTTYKKTGHDGDCPDDQALQQVLELAAQEGWQRCRECRRMVELNIGCNHMTCICRHQFCYLCGVQWKRCRCPQWNEARLYARAEDVANRGRNGAAGPADGAAIAAAAAEIEENHECDHGEWSRVANGPHDCEMCHDTLRRYIWDCDQCHLRVCERCRLNRL